MISDPRKYVRSWISKNNIIVDERGRLQSSDNRDNDEIFKTLYLDYCEQINYFNLKTDKKIRREGKDIIQDALDELISLHVAEERKKIIAAISFSGTENLSFLQTFLIAVTGKAEAHEVAVLAHYIWTIKRKILNRKTAYELMPIVYGKQNGGKSISIKKLLSPLNNLVQSLSLPSVIDPRIQTSFSRTYAVIIDEMAGAHKTDVDALKNLITASDMDVRKLHTNTVTKIKQNVSLIGTTNKPVAELIYDISGSRRFYELRALDKLQWDLINTIDYVTLWQNINENRERGYYEESEKEIVEQQKDLIGLEELQVFLDLYKIKPGNKEISAAILYDTYKQWCETNGIKNPFNSVWFSRRLTGKGFKKPQQKSVRGKNTSVYFIGEEATELHGKTGYDPLAVKDYQ